MKESLATKLYDLVYSVDWQIREQAGSRASRSRAGKLSSG
jgi:hypothetical protein